MDPTFSPDMALADYLRAWLEAQRSQLQPQTWQGYRGVVERYLVPALGEVALDALAPRQLTAVYAALQHRGGRSGRVLSLRTVRYCHAVLHKALSDAVADDVLAANPAARAQLPRVDPTADEDDGELTVWTAEQLRAFLAHADAHPWAELWRTAAGTGLRRAELVGLRWDDVDLAAPALAVRRALEVVGGHARLKRPKSGRSRTLSLDAHTTAALARRRDAQDRDRAAAGGRWRNRWNLVFTDEVGGHLDPMAVTAAFARLVADSGLPRLRLHDIRHTHASLLLQRGVPVNVVSQRLGHASVKLTLEVYAHVLPAMDHDAADRIGEALDDA